MLMRLKEETPEEIAGFALGARSTIEFPDEIPAVDIDWSSYAGKRRQLPWFLLSALLLARNGFKVFMHGTEGHTPGRVYTRECLELMGFPIATSLEEARGQVLASNFTYVPLEVIAPRLKELIGLRPILGLRSPVHSFARMLNPFNAPAMMQGIFHRGFMDVHAGAAQFMNQPAAAVFRGEGGEVERRPNKPCEVWTTRGGEEEPLVEFWPRLSESGHQDADEEMNIADLAAVWRGEKENAYGEASVTGTLAIALKLMGQVDNMESAQALAGTMWADRDKNQLPACS
jgi:anthranilate phosphoribosyltransferase